MQPAFLRNGKGFNGASTVNERRLHSRGRMHTSMDADAFWEQELIAGHVHVWDLR